jgi:hypothetical protein
MENSICCTRGDAGAPLTAEFPLTEEVYLATGGLLAAYFDEVRLIWPQPEQSPDVGGTKATAAQGDDLWLSADGVTIRPMVGGQGRYRFVVPPGTARVRLESRRSVPTDPRAPYLGAGRRLGVRVTEIAIQTRAGEVVIPADDPRLITGWHEAERAGTRLWRWTDGSAELPWIGVHGPAVVKIRWTAL